jgi:hypothetical protein
MQDATERLGHQRRHSSGRHVLLVGVMLVLLFALGTRRAAYAQDVPTTIDDLHQYFVNTVTPQMQAATDCASYQAALTSAVGWAQQAQSLGVDPQTELTEDFAAVNNFQISTDVVCYNEEYATCVSQHDPSQATKMQADRKELLQLGAVNPELIDPDKISKCLTFELDFDTTITIGSTGPQFTVELRAKVPLHPGTNQQSLEGAAPLQHIRWQVSGGRACTGGPLRPGPTTDSTLTVSGLTLSLDPVVAPVDPVDSAVIDIGQPKEQIDAGTSDIDNGARCAAALPVSVGLIFCQTHAAEASSVACNSSFSVKYWNYLGGEVYARKTYSFTGTVAGVPVRENTTIELRHTPQ